MSKFNEIQGKCKVCDGPLFYERIDYNFTRLEMLSCKMCGRKYEVRLAYRSPKLKLITTGRRQRLPKVMQRKIARALKQWMAMEGLNTSQAAERLGYNYRSFERLYNTNTATPTLHERLSKHLPPNTLERI